MNVMLARTGIHLHGTLRFVESDTDWSVYVDRDENEVYLAHGTARVLVPWDELDWAHLWRDWLTEHGGRCHATDFLDMLRECTTEPENVEDLHTCADCGDLEHEDDLYYTNDDHGDVCESCIDSYWTCHDCDERYRITTTTLTGDEVCQGCIENNWSYCDHCEGYRHDEDYDHDHDESARDGGCCESPAMSFSIRNDGLDPLRNDERVTIGLPAGTISAEGFGAIARLIRDHAYTYDDQATRDKVYALSFDLETLGASWQTKEGNFTKRLSRRAYQQQGVKLPPEVISGIGNLANEHSRGTEINIAVTRDLNLPRTEFANDGSCWWTDYASSRCALKTNGGFALRSFGSYDEVTGRAWVMPLKTCGSSLTPTFETMDANAFVVFNGYGSLAGYTAARTLAHMAGMTYRKITFTSEPMYINGSAGYLVAPEDIAEGYTDGALAFELDDHADLYETERTHKFHAAHTTQEEPVHV